MTEQTILYQLPPQSTTQMMCYVFRCPNGELIVIDGGMKCDADNLLKTLKELGGEIPTVQAWFLTHAHQDHIDTFCEIMEHHSNELNVENVYCNFPSVSFIESYENPETHTIEWFERVCPQEKLRRVQTGQQITVGPVKFTVLKTPNPDTTVNAINNSSIVLRCEIYDKSILFLGDLGIEGGEELLQTQPPQMLHADYVQMAHHGQNGVTQEVYQAIAPKACLWTTPVWLWNNDLGNGFNSGPFTTVTVRGWMEQLGCKTHYICKDGLQTIVFEP